MAFCFLSDAFPTYDNSQDSPTTSLYEDFSSVAPGEPARSGEDSDLLAEKFTDYNLPLTPSKDTPQPFDHTSADYLKIIKADWDDTHLVKPQKTTKHHDDCLNVAKHLDECSTCRSRLENIFRKLYQKPETPVNSPAPWYIDIVLLLLIGIFIVFVLDAFVRLGRYLRK